MPRGRKPISDAILVQIADLARAGLSNRQIARQLGISHPTVTAARRRGRGKNNLVERYGMLEPGESACDPPQRCPEGHLCHVLPCRTCAFERQARSRREA